MHMADALLSPAVGAAMYGVTAVAVGKAVREIDAEELGERKLPLMAVSGAFVFAAQMINFTIPGTGSSGHICGGILLSGLLGGGPSLLALAAVLIIQCLFFADGGLLALGANIFNMGVGMVVVLDESEADKAISILQAQGEKASVIGKVTDREGVNIILQ